jgi:hypothetical protein
MASRPSSSWSTCPFPQVLARLRRLARARNLALLITTQVSPRVGHRADKRQALGDIPAYDPLQVRPDLVLGLYREEMDFPESDRPAELDILIEQIGGAQAAR